MTIFNINTTTDVPIFSESVVFTKLSNGNVTSENT